MNSPTPAWHQMLAADACREIGGDPALGLTSEEAALRLARHGDEVRPLNESKRRKFLSVAEQMADQSLRLLAVPIVDSSTIDEDAGFGQFSGRAVFLGFVGQMNPPREEVKVAACRAAGIRPVMVTGDHKATGLAIARMLGMAEANDRAVDGPEGDEMTRKPIRIGEPLITRAILRRMAVMVPTSAAATLGYFIWRLSTGAPFAVVQTETFTLLAVCQ